MVLPGSREFAKKSVDVLPSHAGRQGFANSTASNSDMTDAAALQLFASFTEN